MYCQKCGSSIGTDAKFCGGCGIRTTKKANPFLVAAVIFSA
ncbi:hypothetical protein JMA_34430 [Jeotgalibacillus malaysiensis]|uniref:Zinc-ribbon domain-containing protein n=1 Tax=Jeotgalibacillus malaysiensis TaxID=1508404 RepID=A0A0B5AR88_9BACL|nr:zinc-ribbon domain-containing protein [Jeotgalibacillus malaysiensis]AJD92760.1 hypothetical protein JMA_34430 [Jeotgalibacillus malaysiensis]